jgi:hypothetical protein
MSDGRCAAIGKFAPACVGAGQFPGRLQFIIPNALPLPLVAGEFPAGCWLLVAGGPWALGALGVGVGAAHFPRSRPPAGCR